MKNQGYQFRGAYKTHIRSRICNWYPIIPHPKSKRLLKAKNKTQKAEISKTFTAHSVTKLTKNTMEFLCDPLSRSKVDPVRCPPHFGECRISI